MTGLLCYCRAGFEPELAAELTTRAAEAGYPGYARTDRDSGHVVFMADDAAALSRKLPWRELIFARQKLVLLVELRGLGTQDRITPIIDALMHPAAATLYGEPGFGQPGFGQLVVEHPDSDAAKPLSGLARAFGNALRPALRKAGRLSERDDTTLPRLHVCFITGDHAFIAYSDPGDSAPWPLGIPRLRLHRDAPSRSALKL
ncbi:MAG: 23S rRNA (cytidine(2498)-2'-O)-methyltransferase RlmM, partial [Luteimonas sp.]